VWLESKITSKLPDSRLKCGTSIETTTHHLLSVTRVVLCPENRYYVWHLFVTFLLKSSLMKKKENPLETLILASLVLVPRVFLTPERGREMDADTVAALCVGWDLIVMGRSKVKASRLLVERERDRFLEINSSMHTSLLHFKTAELLNVY